VLVGAGSKDKQGQVRGLGARFVTLRITYSELGDKCERVVITIG
jgi:hypothetical protein